MQIQIHKDIWKEKKNVYYINKSEIPGELSRVNMTSSHVKIYMLFVGWEVRKVKNCDRGLENAARGHSFSPYGPTLSRQITCLFFFSAVNWFYRVQMGLFPQLLSLRAVC